MRKVEKCSFPSSFFLPLLRLSLHTARRNFCSSTWWGYLKSFRYPQNPTTHNEWKQQKIVHSLFSAASASCLLVLFCCCSQLSTWDSGKNNTTTEKKWVNEEEETTRLGCWVKAFFIRSGVSLGVYIGRNEVYWYRARPIKMRNYPWGRTFYHLLMLDALWAIDNIDEIASAEHFNIIKKFARFSISS